MSDTDLRAELGPDSRLAAHGPSRAGLTRALSLLGWELAHADIDADRGFARLELRRDDGLILTFAADSGRVSTTRERAVRTTHTVGRRGDRAVVERVSVEFIGRTRHLGVRSGLRWLAGYIAENTAVALPPSAVRALLAPLLAHKEGEGRP